MRIASMAIASLAAVVPSTLVALSTAAVQVGGSVSDNDYPKEAIKRGIEGDVRVSFSVNKKGRVDDCKSTSQEDNAVLLTASCKVVQRFRFRAAKSVDGEKMEEIRAQSFAWRLYSACPVTKDPSLICINLNLKRR
jgi:TonB family protein